MSDNDNMNLLIDFSSPAVKDNHKPLIPVPCLKGSAVLATNDDPFDMIATEAESSILHNDPFDLIFKTAFEDKFVSNTIDEQDGLSNSKSSYLDKENCPNNKNTNNIVKESLQLYPINKINENTSNYIEECDISKVTIGDCSSIRLDDSDYSANNKFSQSHIEEKEDNSNLISKHQVLDISSEECLKAVIATRVSKCIEKALNNTGHTTANNQTKDNFTENESIDNNTFKHRYTRRSLTTSVIKKDCVNEYSNKSFTGGLFILNNDEIVVPLKKTIQSTSSSVLSTDLNKGFLGSASSNISPIPYEKSLDDNVFLLDDQIFGEANKLANSFNKLANEDNNLKKIKEDENDLMACKPVLLYADSSEDETELLLNDPSLNFQSSSKLGLSQSFTIDKKKEDSEALIRFKNSRSKDSSESMNNSSKIPLELTLRRSHSWDAPLPKSIPQPCRPIPGPIHPDFSSGLLKPLRVKNKVTPTSHVKGPLKAVVPIQLMTKSTENKGNMINGELCKTIKNSVGTSHKKDKCIKQPIAASTPRGRRSYSSLTRAVSPHVEAVITKKKLSLDCKTLMKNKDNYVKMSDSKLGLLTQEQLNKSGKFDKNKSILQTKFGGKNSNLQFKPSKPVEKVLPKLKNIVLGKNMKDKENRVPKT
uniref:Uncharacterized protein n=2 Tax=Clastoptera arizonana TaxID=38151 RepID=A0A1B6CFZ9_9HEMI